MLRPRQLATRGALALAASLLVSSAWAAPKDDVSDEARRLFRAGVSYLEDPDGARFEEAYRAFTAAYAASPSPKMLGNIGLCAMKLERDREAIEAYQTYLREVKDLDGEERAQITRDLSTLRAGLVRVTLATEPPLANVAATIVDVRRANDGSRVENTYPAPNGVASLGIRAGHHELRLRVPGYEEATWELDAVAGMPRTYVFPIRPRAVPRGAASVTDKRSLVGPVAVTATGAALLAVSVVTGVIALQKTNDIAAHCPADRCPKAYDLADRRSEAKGFIHATDGFLVGGSVVAGAGIAWLGYTLHRNAQTATTAARSFSGSAFCTGEGCSGAVRFAF